MIATTPTRPSPAPHVTLIEPSLGWQPLRFGELWKHRELVYFLAWRDVKVRYKQTLLGAAWAVLQPLLMMLVFTLFLGRLAGVQTPSTPYPLFVFAGLLPWNFFATAIAAASQSVVGSERLITKVYFPRLAVPFAAVAAALVDFVVALVLLGALLWWYGVEPSWTWLAAPLAMAFVAVAALGVGSLLAALNVAYRDFRYVVPFLVQFWMFATPTIYLPITPATAAGALSPAATWLLYANPLTALVALFRAALLGESLPWVWAAPAAAASLLGFLGACFVFRRIEQSFADVI